MSCEKCQLGRLNLFSVIWVSSETNVKKKLMKPNETNRTISSAKSRDKILRVQKFNLPMAKNSGATHPVSHQYPECSDYHVDLLHLLIFSPSSLFSCYFLRFLCSFFLILLSLGICHYTPSSSLGTDVHYASHLVILIHVCHACWHLAPSSSVLDCLSDIFSPGWSLFLCCHEINNGCTRGASMGTTNN